MGHRFQISAALLHTWSAREPRRAFRQKAWQRRKIEEADKYESLAARAGPSKARKHLGAGGGLQDTWLGPAAARLRCEPALSRSAVHPRRAALVIRRVVHAPVPAPGWARVCRFL